MNSRVKAFRQLNKEDREAHCSEFCRNNDQTTTNFLNKSTKKITKGKAVHNHLRVLCECEQVTQEPLPIVNPDTPDTTKRPNRQAKHERIPLPVQERIIEHLGGIDKSLLISIVHLAQIHALEKEDSQSSKYTMYKEEDIPNLNVRQLLIMRTRPSTEKAKQNTLKMMKFLEKAIIRVPQTVTHYYQYRIIKVSLILLQDIINNRGLYINTLVAPVLGTVSIFVSMLAGYLLDEFNDATNRGIRESWKNWLSYNSWREWFVEWTAQGSLRERDTTGFTNIIHRDKNGMATAHLRQVDQHLDTLLTMHMQHSYPKNEYEYVINKAEEILDVKWDNLTFSEQVLWIASAQTSEQKDQPTLDETKLKCDLLQNTQRDCGDVIVSNLISNDNTQSYELAARLLAARNHGRRP